MTEIKLNAEGQALWEEKFARGMVRNFAPPDFPVIVCLCGSTRFMEAWQAANLSETLAGRIVLSIGCNTKSDADLQRLGELTAEKKRELDDLHKRKIDLADEILVLNVGGYVGSSTRGEVLHAYARGKKVRWLEPDNIPDDLRRETGA